MFGYSNVSLSLNDFIDAISEGVNEPDDLVQQFRQDKELEASWHEKRKTHNRTSASSDSPTASSSSSAHIAEQVDVADLVLLPAESNHNHNNNNSSHNNIVIVVDAHRAPLSIGLQETDMSRDRLAERGDVVTMLRRGNRREAIKRVYLSSGIVDDDERVRYWLLQSRAEALMAHNSGLYGFLRAKRSKYEQKIGEDVPRTLPDVAEFGSDEARSLANVLRAYTLYDTAVGYSQGMNFVAAPLVMRMDEERAFWTFAALMKESKLERFFRADGLFFDICIKTFEQLLAAHFPALRRHLAAERVSPELYLPQWFRTFFLYTGRFDLNLRVVDAFFVHGIEALFRVALAILQLLRNRLLQSNFMQITGTLSRLDTLPEDPALILTTAAAQQISFVNDHLELDYLRALETQRDTECLFQ
jgi:Rab-GTPase-TBC domain